MKHLNRKQIFAMAMALIMMLLAATPAFATGEATAEMTPAEVIESFGMTGGTYHKNGSDVPAKAEVDANGNLVVVAGGTGGNLHLFADIDAFKGTLTDYTVEVTLTGIEVTDGWHYGFGINNKADNGMKTYLTVRSGAYAEGQTYGQVLCYLNGNTRINDAILGEPNTDFASMSAAVNVENVLSITVSKTAGTVIYKVNGVVAATQTIGEKTADVTLQDVSFIIPNKQTVAYESMRILDGEGKLVDELTFTEPGDVSEELENAALLERLNMTSGKFHKNAIETPKSAKLDDQGRFLLEAGGTGGNIHVYPELGDFVKGLTDYTVEVKLAGINVTDNWHYGFGINNKADNAMKSYFTIRSGAYTEGQTYGQTLCYLNGNTGIKTAILGKPDTDFASMSAALNEENVLSITVSKTAGTVIYKVNGVVAATQTIGANTADLTLQDVCMIVPNNQIVAYSYIRVYDQENAMVYEQDFSVPTELTLAKEGKPAAYVQMTEADAQGKQNIRAIVCVSEEYLDEITDLTMTLKFTMKDTTTRTATVTMSQIKAYTSVYAADQLYAAAEGCVLFGVVITNVPAAEWTGISLSTTVEGTQAAVDAYTVSGSLNAN